MSDTETIHNTFEDDEMPPAPPEEGSSDAPSNEIEIGGSIDASMVETADDLNQPIPQGTYPFRLKSYTCGGKINDDGLGADPYFNVQWECLDPRFARRIVFDFITFVRDIDIQRANAGDPDARAKIKGRLARLKEVQKAAGYKPHGNYNVRTDFLDKQPELKLQLRIGEKKDKNPLTGKYDVPTGDKQNNIQKYLPMVRQA